MYASADSTDPLYTSEKVIFEPKFLFELSIEDDDVVGVYVSQIELSIATMGMINGTYGIELMTQPYSDVSISIASTHKDVLVSKSQLVFTPSQWNVQKEVTVFTMIKQKSVSQVYVEHTLLSQDSMYDSLSVPPVSVSIVELQTPEPPVPRPQFVRFDSSGASLLVQFDSATNRGVGKLKSLPSGFQCSGLFVTTGLGQGIPISSLFHPSTFFPSFLSPPSFLSFFSFFSLSLFDGGNAIFFLFYAIVVCVFC